MITVLLLLGKNIRSRIFVYPQKQGGSISDTKNGCGVYVGLCRCPAFIISFLPHKNEIKYYIYQILTS